MVVFENGNVAQTRQILKKICPGKMQRWVRDEILATQVLTSPIFSGYCQVVNMNELKTQVGGKNRDSKALSPEIESLKKKLPSDPTQQPQIDTNRISFHRLQMVM
jgi:vancomycin resistance protein YoaR